MKTLGTILALLIASLTSPLVLAQDFENYGTSQKMTDPTDGRVFDQTPFTYHQLNHPEDITALISARLVPLLPLNDGTQITLKDPFCASNSFLNDRRHRALAYAPKIRTIKFFPYDKLITEPQAVPQKRTPTFQVQTFYEYPSLSLEMVTFECEGIRVEEK